MKNTSKTQTELLIANLQIALGTAETSAAAVPGFRLDRSSSRLAVKLFELVNRVVSAAEEDFDKARFSFEGRQLESQRLEFAQSFRVGSTLSLDLRAEFNSAGRSKTIRFFLVAEISGSSFKGSISETVAQTNLVNSVVGIGAFAETAGDDTLRIVEGE